MMDYKPTPSSEEDIAQLQVVCAMLPRDGLVNLLLTLAEIPYGVACGALKPADLPPTAAELTLHTINIHAKTMLERRRQEAQRGS